MVEKKAKKEKESGVTIQTVAELLGVSIHTLRNWDISGKLPARRGKNRYRYYHIRDVMRFAKENNIRGRKTKNRLVP
jgi:predicted site-specific integrase-resolvase